MSADIFDNTILCKKCEKKMKREDIIKNGFHFRTLICDKCGERLVHPSDVEEYKKFNEIKNKQFDVKLRMVGNSYAVSIPREIVDFMHEQEKIMNDMVRLCFEDAGSLSLKFNSDNKDARVIKAREVRVVKNNKPVLHARQFYDSAHPERNQSKIFKANKEE